MSLKYIQVIILVSVFTLQYFFEHIYPQQKNINSWKNERFNIAVGLINMAITFLPAYFLVQFIFYIQTRNLGLLNLIHLPLWLKIIISIFLLDVWMYTWHRLNHRMPWLWKFHSFHHKDEKMNSTTALRFHIVELLFSYPPKALVCLVFGISYIPLLTYEILFSINVIFHHSNMNISQRADNMYRIFFASPLMHRIHHSKKIEETNSNFGAVFSFWDFFFKSKKNKPSGKIEFGIFTE